MTQPSDDFVNCWPMYISDEGRVTCNESNCPEPEFLQSIPYRRHTFGEIRMALIKHIKEDH